MLTAALDIMMLVPLLQPYAYAARMGFKSLGFIVGLFKVSSEPTWQEQVRDIVEEEVKKALESNNRDHFSLQLQVFDQWVNKEYLPWRNSGIAEREKLAKALYTEMRGSLYDAWEFFKGEPDGEGGDERFRDCMGLFLYTTGYRMMGYQELYSLDVPSSFEDDLEDPTDPILRLNLYTKLITQLVDEAYPLWKQWFEYYRGELYKMPNLDRMGKRLELAYELIHASDGQAVPSSMYSLIKEKPTEKEGTWTRQTWDTHNDCAADIAKGHFAPWRFTATDPDNRSVKFEGINVYLPGTYVVKAYIQEPRRAGYAPILNSIDTRVRTSKSNQDIPIGDTYSIGTEEEYPGGPLKPDVGAYRRAFNDEVDLSAGDLVSLDLSLPNEYESVNSVALALEMVRGQDLYFDINVALFSSQTVNIDEPPGEKFVRYASWIDDDMNECGEWFFAIDGQGGGISVNNDRVDYDFEASIKLKTISGDSAEVTVSAAAFTQDGRMVNLSQELERPELSQTKMIGGDGTDFEFSVKDIVVGTENTQQVWTLRVECSEPVEIDSNSTPTIYMRRVSTSSECYAQVTKASLIVRPDDDSGFTKSIVTWESNNLNVVPQSIRVPNEYVSNLSDVGARLKKDIDLDYVVVIAKVKEIKVVEDNSRDPYQVNMTLWGHKGGSKAVIGSGRLSPEELAEFIDEEKLDMLSAEMRHRRLEDLTSFSVTFSASHETELEYVSLYMLPEKPLMFRGH
ncbi:MAG: hypothetical protein F6K36_16035 [Symploca sp. SIO3C6]|nr:hypothetical protein [Symploca sp. SIO3C6]